MGKRLDMVKRYRVHSPDIHFLFIFHSAWGGNGQPYIFTHSLDIEIFLLSFLFTISTIVFFWNLKTRTHTHTLTFWWLQNGRRTVWFFMPHFFRRAKSYYRFLHRLVLWYTHPPTSRRMGWHWTDTPLFLKWFFILSSFILFDHQISFYYTIYNVVSLFIVVMQMNPTPGSIKYMWYSMVLFLPKITFSIYACMHAININIIRNIRFFGANILHL